MYLEFLILIKDYYKTLKLQTLIYEVLFPIIISIATFFLIYIGHNTSICRPFIDSVLTLLGILLGFSITIITILNTGSTENLIEIKKKETNHIIGGKKITLFHLLSINFTYSVVLEIILILFLLLYPIFLSNIELNPIFKICGFAILCGSIVHVLLLTMRNITDFYFILMK